MDIQQTLQSNSERCFSHSKSERKPLMSSQSISKKFAERKRIMVQQESSLVIAHMMAKKNRNLRVHQGPPEDHHKLFVNDTVKANEGCVPTDDESIDDLPGDVPRTIVFETPTSGRSLCSSQESKLQQEQLQTENRGQKIQDVLAYSKILDTLTDRFRHLEIVTDDNDSIQEFKTRKEY
mmetsp:Transcript_3695/g.5433  ORF Transcript_3695/g.5433 Transcript_3695/m.5433 type:complete len:179 (-) Transcript_3695:283-819(-)